MATFKGSDYTFAKKAYEKLLKGQPLTYTEQGYLWRCIIEKLQEIDEATQRSKLFE